MYVGGSLLGRFIQHHRHRIAPVATLVDAVPTGSDVVEGFCSFALLLLAASILRMESTLRQELSRLLAKRQFACAVSFKVLRRISSVARSRKDFPMEHSPLFVSLMFCIMSHLSHKKRHFEMLLRKFVQGESFYIKTCATALSGEQE
jgi:hypothetical protein